MNRDNVAENASGFPGKNAADAEPSCSDGD